jgi:FO synthase
MAHALIPLKDLELAKTRLAGVLTPAERRDLARAMLEDVLDVLEAHPGIDRVTVLSGDAGAADLCDAGGVDFLPESTLGCSGLNAVLQAATAGLDHGPDDTLLVLHGDLPLLTGRDISAALAARERSGGLVIGCDRHGLGTNLLLFSGAATPVFSFGEGSCDAHRAWAMGAHVPVTVLERPGIGLDVDEPADLELLLQRAADKPHCKTLQCLRRGPVAVRLALDWQALSERVEAGGLPDEAQAAALAGFDDTAALVQLASRVRDRGHGNVVTYSRKVFIPLTHLCRDVCHYCTFAQTPKRIEQPYMPVEEVLALCREGARQGCQEALFTLGEKPELRYSTARRALQDMGFDSTLDYVRHVASRVLEETGLLPHINAGCMTAEEIDGLREVSASMGIMLESASPRLCEKGMPHYGSPDKDPARRLETLELAGRAAVPFTSGILIGIGETRSERIESLLALRRVHERHGHLQEVIVQNFRAKPGTLMASAPEPDLEELLWTIAVARLLFGPKMNIQAPPNLSPGVLPQLVAAGINDWGGVSPLTPDHVNPEAPWPHLDRLARETAAAGKFLDQRLTIYPAYVQAPERWLAQPLRTPVLKLSDADGFARRDDWVPGEERDVPRVESALLAGGPAENRVSPRIRDIVSRCLATGELDESDVQRLFEARGDDFAYIAQQADLARAAVNGDTVSYVVNRNINYTNVCYFKCQFCAFSKGKQHESLRGEPYDISAAEIAARCSEAWRRGATEVCMQGGIHPDYTGQTYLDILQTVKTATPGMHVHAFSPLEVWQGAQTLGVPLAQFVARLRDAGLGTLPGTAAEVLHDEVRATLCPDKINTAQWLAVIEAAHEAGLKTTATIMYGHVDRPRHWAAHLMHIRRLQQRTGGFTEFVPLPFVHMEAPMYLRGGARKGPTFREALLMHAVARLVFHGLIDNIQASWVKMGAEGVAACLEAGVNDLGGSLMNESITRAAGSGHGQEWAPADMERRIRAANRVPRMRTTLYADAPAERARAAHAAPALVSVRNERAGKQQRSKRLADIPAQPVRLPGAHGGDASVYERVVLMAACN